MKSVSNRNTAVRIRVGTRRDIPTILRLIRGLAEYEKLSSEVVATAKRLRRDGFGPRPYFRTFLCWRGRDAIGFALYFFTYSTFLGSPTLYIEDIFVLSEERRKGIGKMLLKALAGEALKRKCGRMEWAVLHWNAPTIQFYERIGARLRREWILTRLTGKELRRLAHSRP